MMKNRKFSNLISLGGGRQRYVIFDLTQKINFNVRELNNKHILSLKGGTL